MPGRHGGRRADGPGGRQRRRLATTVVTALVTALVITGCAGLPGSGPVLQGRRLDEPVDELIRVAPRAPVDGDTPEEIARGFIRAGEDSDETHATAKLYLAHSSVDLWRWGAAETVIYNRSRDLKVEVVADAAVKVSVTPVGFLSVDGRYRDAPLGSTVTATFGLTKTGGEWRLELPREGFGLWLEAGAFDGLYVHRPVHYVLRDGRQLVPDQRWFLNSSRLATSLARAQLEPVPAHLDGAVTTGVPPLTRLAVNSVRVEGGHAEIDLSAAALDAGPEERRAMWAQLSATLSGASISSISVLADGASLELPGIGSVVDSAQQLGYRVPSAPQVDTALLREDETFRRIRHFVPDGSVGRSQPNTKPQPNDPVRIIRGWFNLSLSWDGSQVAAIGGDLKQLSLWPGSGETVTLPGFGTNLTRAVYDPQGYLLVGGVHDGAAAIWAVDSTVTDPAPKPVPLDVPWLKDRRVVAIAVAADGARALVITSDQRRGDLQLAVAGIVRAATGQPTRLAAPLRQAQQLSAMRDVVWLGPDSFAVLGRLAQPGEPVRVWIGDVGAGLEGIRGSSDTEPARGRLEPRPNARRITTTGGETGLLAITDDDVVYARVGASWRELATGSDVLVPGM